jgi:TonB family protein
VFLREVALFEFTIPAESAPQSPRSLAVSIAVHGLAILLLFAIRFSSVSRFPAAPEHYTLIAPAKETPVAPPKLEAPRPREFHPVPPAPVHLTTLSVLMPAPVIEIPKPILPEIPRPAPPVAVSIPVVKPSGFAEVKPTAPAVEPKPVVKATGFESSETSAKAPARRALSALGSFESAHAAEGAPVRATIAQPGAFADASSSTPDQARRKLVSSAAFGDTTVEKSAAPSRQIAVPARLTPVEILSKPKPEFTAEARAKSIEGEVLLDVEFTALGKVRVLRVVRGLGHGLDENAVAAAEGIRFRPAVRDGAAVNSTALVHIVFQLAN